MFKLGDTVYCIDINNNNEKSLELDTQYVIIGQSFSFKFLLLNNIPDYYFKYNTFISEKEYKISKRTDKIKKIKECLK